METKVKPDLSKQFEEKPVEWMGKWQNHWFHTDGTKAVDPELYASQNDAYAAYLEHLASAKIEPCYPNLFGDLEGGATVDFQKYSHTLQIPVND